MDVTRACLNVCAAFAEFTEVIVDIVGQVALAIDAAAFGGRTFFVNGCYGFSSAENPV